METSQLRKFASFARQSLLEQVETKLSRVLAEGSLARKENPRTVQQLEARIKDLGQQQTIEMVAYTWFNRFCALRYMDVNRYTKVGVVSPAEGQFQPEMLADAKMGHINEEIVPAGTRERVMRLLDQTDPSDDPQGEAYRLLLVAVCNHYHSLMPFMFEKIADYTELLLPDDLLSGNSILAEMREALIPENCSPEHTDESVEVIGWLYQFYIADRKDDVFAALKKGKKITPENIPAATQLFTPHWIVRYLVENSLGRLWMLNHPDSKLVEQMDYYIKPDSGEPDASARDHEHDAGTLTEASGAEVSLANASGYEEDFLKISSPEEIKICDPACGSGHMLTYAFDLLYAIYEEQGYQATDIPRLILTHNLYGIEIDQRAGALAAFALTMKAREKYRRFLTGGKVVQPNICVLENISIDPEDLDAYLAQVGRDLFSGGLQGVVNQWEEADNFGSLIRPLVTDVSEVLELLRERQMGEDLFLAGVHQKVLTALRQADYLSPKYHVVVANPPYMGVKNSTQQLKAFAKANYPDTKSDLFGMFIERSLELVYSGGLSAMVTMQSWMFLSSFEELRRKFLETMHLVTMAHFGSRAFDTIGGAVVSTTTAIFERKSRPEKKGVFIRVTDGESEAEKESQLLGAISSDSSPRRFQVCGNELLSIPSNPIAYWVQPKTRGVFSTASPLGEVLDVRQGMATTDNNTYLRVWSELPFPRIGFGCSDAKTGNAAGFNWFPYNKGGEYRKWYGNNVHVVLYEDDGKRLLDMVRDKYPRISDPEFVIKNRGYYFRPSITWSFVGTNFGVRYSDAGYIFDVGGSSAFIESDDERVFFTGLLASNLATHFMGSLNPSLNFQVENVQAIPNVSHSPAVKSQVTKNVKDLIRITKEDWDSFEVSWDFERNPTLSHGEPKLEVAATKLRDGGIDLTARVRDLEATNNSLLIESYGLSDEVQPDVPLHFVSLHCNPKYRYDEDKSDSELECLLLADTMREFISYAVGCMLGRYSLDKPGLILANQGETADDYLLKHYRTTRPINPREAILNPKTVVFREIYELSCMVCGGFVDFDEAVYCVERGIGLGGEGEQLLLGCCEDCVEIKDERKLRSLYGSYRLPKLKDFSVTNILRDDLVRKETLTTFLEKAGCFAHAVPRDPEDLKFLPDDDNVIPLLDGDWFTDDISERFKEFLKVTFGTEHYEENLTFLENALYPDNLTGKKRKTIRTYFLKEFYNHHVKLYKKRPIYWMFSSPKGTFNALVYLHRYRPDTVSTVLQYLRDFQEKLAHRRDHLQAVADSGSASQSEKTKALKEVATLKKQLKELEDYESATLFPLAQKRIEIDLDDGVKHNYPIFGKALKKVTGLSGK